MTSPEAWLVFLTLCALLGATGQAARAIVGLKKLKDATADQGESFYDAFKPSTLIVSLIIGAVAGVVAGLALGIPEAAATAEDTQAAGISTEFALGIMASGYAGADFIEGFMSRESARFSQTTSAPGDEAPPTTPPVG